MEPNSPIESTGPADLRCPTCQDTIKPEDKFCPACGARVNVSIQEQEQINHTRIAIQHKLEKSVMRADEGRSALWIVAVLNVLAGIYHFLLYRETPVYAFRGLIAALVIAALFIFLTQWGKRKPFAALFLGLILFITLVAGVMVAQFINWISWLGLFIALLIAGGIIRGAIGAKQAEDLRKELKALR